MDVSNTIINWQPMMTAKVIDLDNRLVAAASTWVADMSIPF
jgi:hypothetical protein